MINITLQGTEQTTMSVIERLNDLDRIYSIYGTITTLCPPTEQNCFARHTDWLGVQRVIAQLSSFTDAFG